MTWDQIIKRERLSVGRHIKIIDKVQMDCPGHDIRTIVYKPKPIRDAHMNNLYRHEVRVSTYINGSHVGSAGSKSEWSQLRKLEDRY